jgi:hypothetical protein
MSGLPEADTARYSPFFVRVQKGATRFAERNLWNFLLPIFVGLSHSGLIPAPICRPPLGMAVVAASSTVARDWLETN